MEQQHNSISDYHPFDVTEPALYDSFNHSNPSLKIRNGTSSFGSLYQISAPFQLTLEYCSDAGPDGFINILTLSPDEAFYYQETYDLHHSVFSRHQPHFHDYFELMLILEGSITQKIEDREYLYPAGTCCLINRSLRHTEDFNSRAKVLFIGLSLDFIEELFNSCKNAYFKSEKEFLESDFYHFVKSDIKNPGQKSYLDFIPAYQNHEHPEHLHDTAEAMLHTLMFPAFGTTYQIKGMICTLLQYLSAPVYYHCTCVKLDTSSDFLLFSRITHLLEERDGRMTRAELEKVLNYSGDYLNRIVNKYAGMCIFDYGMTFCLKKAALLLSSTQESISSIASSLHFSNRTHFYSLFKKHYGITPKEYRQKSQQSNCNRSAGS